MKAHLKRFAQSKQWNGKIFENQNETVMDIGLRSFPRLLRENFQGRKSRGPQSPLPMQPFNSELYYSNPSIPKFIWYGHSALLLQLNNKNILIDPMLGDNASPIAPFATRRYSENVLNTIDEMPEIDLLLMTHDHYDHLDYESIKRLKPKVKQWFVALGAGRHLEKWGIPDTEIMEFDWWDTTDWEGIHLVFTPSRHFSGRGLFDRAKSLWGGWVFITDKNRIYWSGDGGYDDHFKVVGDKYGPFDWGFMECGQYHELWHAIHMYPEEAVQAAADAKVHTAIPVHWAGFTLALHHWTDPAERFTAKAKAMKQNYLMPELGDIIELGEEAKSNWWKVT